MELSLFKVGIILFYHFLSIFYYVHMFEGNLEFFIQFVVVEVSFVFVDHLSEVSF